MPPVRPKIRDPKPEYPSPGSAKRESFRELIAASHAKSMKQGMESAKGASVNACGRERQPGPILPFRREMKTPQVVRGVVGRTVMLS